MPSLSELLQQAGLGDASVTGDAGIAITSISSDSRELEQGALFVALAGTKADGTQYIPEALRKGAAAIVVARGARVDMVATVPIVRVDDARRAVSLLAAAFYGKQPKYMFAVTGTDGKTSTADFTRQLAGLMGHKAASIGTLGLRSPVDEINATFPKINTSPEPVLLQRTLAALCSKGVQHLAIEASSHGLDQRRLDGITFTAATFTNLTREHLDYHGDVETYARAKYRLFDTLLPEGATAVLNRDDVRFDALKAICEGRGIAVKSFGKSEGAEYRVMQVTPHAEGLKAQVVIGKDVHAVELPLYGAFQLSNMLCAVIMLQVAGENAAAMMAQLPKLQGVPGRLEKVANYKGAPVFVDYAHTPAALENILKTLRPHTQKKLHVLFGAGGDRDQGKRPEMGRVAMQHADVVTVTDDNPRGEDPAMIRAAILAAAKGAKEIGDRAKAIRSAIKQLEPGDLLVVAGKGHETTQTIGEQVIHFSDAEHIREAVGSS